MSLETTAANTLMFILGIAGIGLACAGIRAYQRDAFRQKAFAIRDRLFDYAASGHVAFNDPAYWELRLNMNRVIQYSHRLNFGEAMLPLIIGRHLKQSPSPAPSYTHWVTAMDRQPSEVRAELVKIHREFQRAMVLHLFATTPLAWIWAVPFILMGTLKDALSQLVARAWIIEEEALRESEFHGAQAA
jgi:hypothetical protein